LKGLVDHQKGDRGKNILQDNQDISLTEEEKQRLVQSDLKPGQVMPNLLLKIIISIQQR